VSAPAQPAVRPIAPQQDSLHEEEALGKAYDAHLLRRLWRYVAPHRWQVVLTLLLVAPMFVLELAPAWIIKAGLDHACGGVCACSTCHVIFKQGLESCNEATDAELDELDMAPGITPHSRLGCQTVPDGTTDIVVEIPEWNKNFAKEADH